MSAVTFTCAAGILIIFVMMIARCVSWAIRGFAVRDLRRWGALGIWCVILVAWVILTSPARERARTEGRLQAGSGVARMYQFLSDPASDQSLPWFMRRGWSGGAVSVEQLFAYMMLGVSVVLLLRSRPVRVMYFRAFRSEASPELALTMMRAVSLGDRCEALCSGAHDTWGLAGSPLGDRWKSGVERMIKKLRVAIMDVTDVTESVRYEISLLREHSNVATIYVAREGAVVTDEFSPLVRYRNIPDEQLRLDIRHAWESIMDARDAAKRASVV